MIAKYVEIKKNEVVFDLQMDENLTCLTASFPLNGKRKEAAATG